MTTRSLKIKCGDRSPSELIDVVSAAAIYMGHGHAHIYEVVKGDPPQTNELSREGARDVIFSWENVSIGQELILDVDYAVTWIFVRMSVTNEIHSPLEAITFISSKPEIIKARLDAAGAANIADTLNKT